LTPKKESSWAWWNRQIWQRCPQHPLHQRWLHGVHLVTLHLRAAQHRFRFRRVKKQLVLQEPQTDIVSTLRDWFKRRVCVRLQCRATYNCVSSAYWW